jgi:hypothetical protein
MEAFGQSEALTTRLRHIIQAYADGPGILMELIQNADDAGAGTVAFLLDYTAYPTNSLLGGWARFPGSPHSTSVRCGSAGAGSLNRVLDPGLYGWAAVVAAASTHFPASEGVCGMFCSPYRVVVPLAPVPGSGAARPQHFTPCASGRLLSRGHACLARRVRAAHVWPLAGPNMSAWQGPALVCYNDSVFSPSGAAAASPICWLHAAAFLHAGGS